MPTPVTFVCRQLVHFVLPHKWIRSCAGAYGKVQLEVRAPSLVCVISSFGRPCLGIHSGYMAPFRVSLFTSCVTTHRQYCCIFAGFVGGELEIVRLTSTYAIPPPDRTCFGSLMIQASFLLSFWQGLSMGLCIKYCDVHRQRLIV